MFTHARGVSVWNRANCEAWPPEAPSDGLLRRNLVSTFGRDDVARLADLARIELDDDELDRLAPQLQVILDAVASIQDVIDVGVPQTSHPIAMINVFRQDVERQCLTPEQALSGAPEVEKQQFVVPRIRDNERSSAGYGRLEGPS